MTKLAGVLIAALAIGGCASSPKPYWHKPGATSDDAYTELSECRFRIGLNKIPKKEEELMVAHCMRGKGFRLLANDSRT
jgi:hypothetical protein